MHMYMYLLSKALRIPSCDHVIVAFTVAAWELRCEGNSDVGTARCSKRTIHAIVLAALRYGSEQNLPCYNILFAHTQYLRYSPSHVRLVKQIPRGRL